MHSNRVRSLPLGENVGGVLFGRCPYFYDWDFFGEWSVLSFTRLPDVSQVLLSGDILRNIPGWTR